MNLQLLLYEKKKETEKEMALQKVIFFVLQMKQRKYRQY